MKVLRFLFPILLLLLGSLACALSGARVPEPAAGSLSIATETTESFSPEPLPPSDDQQSAAEQRIGAPIDVNIPLDRCSALNERTETLRTLAEPDASSEFLAQFRPYTYIEVTERSENGWFAANAEGFAGWLDGSQIRLFGDCIDIALKTDNYEPPPFLHYIWDNPCRFIPFEAVALDSTDGPGGNALLLAGERYVVIGQNETQYSIALGDASGGWINKDKGALDGDCAGYQ